MMFEASLEHVIFTPPPLPPPLRAKHTEIKRRAEEVSIGVDFSLPL